MLEDPAIEPPPYVFQRTISPEEAPDKATVITIGFEKGDAVSVNGKPLCPANLLATLNDSAATTASAASISSRTASSA